MFHKTALFSSAYRKIINKVKADGMNENIADFLIPIRNFLGFTAIDFRSEFQWFCGGSSGTSQKLLFFLLNQNITKIKRI